MKREEFLAASAAIFIPLDGKVLPPAETAVCPPVPLPAYNIRLGGPSATYLKVGDIMRLTTSGAAIRLERYLGQGYWQYFPYTPERCPESGERTVLVGSAVQEGEDLSPRTITDGTLLWNEDSLVPSTGVVE